MDDPPSLGFTCLICHYWTKWYGIIPSCVYVHPQVNLQCDNCLRCVQAPRELLAHVQTHGHPIGHLLSSYRSRSPRESAAELASADSYVPESRILSRSTSVFDDASYASSRVVAAKFTLRLGLSTHRCRPHLHNHWLNPLKFRQPTPSVLPLYR